MPSERDTPREFRATGSVSIVAAKGEDKLATFEGVAYTGAPMKPEGWWQPIIVDLQGVKVPSQHRPVLRQHDPEQIVGHTTEVKVTAKGIEVAGVFSGEPQHTAKVVHPASNGFQWQQSIGANPKRTEFLEAGETTTVNGREVTGPMTISRETEIGEISFVPLGADGDTSAKVTAQRGSTMSPWHAPLKQLMADLRAAGGKKVRLAKYSDEDIDKMDKDEARANLRKCMKAADEEEEEDDEGKKSESAAQRALMAELEKGIQASREKYAGELERQAEIEKRVRAHGVGEIEVDGKKVHLVTHAIRAGLSANDAELLALRAARPGPGVGVPGGLAYSTSTPEVSEAVLEAAVLEATNCEVLSEGFFGGTHGEREHFHQPTARRIKAEMRSRYPEQVQDTAHRLFKGRIGLQQLLTIVARQGGYDGREVISDMNLGQVAEACMRIRADGGSTISIANVTANVQNKFLLQGYMYTEQAWSEVCNVKPVKDFKPTKSINLFGDTEFKDLGENGELANATLQDQAFANQVSTRGRIITLPRTSIINDDIGALGSVPMLLGRGAGLKLNRIFWTLWLNPGKDENGSTDFYAASHTLAAGQQGNANYLSGGSSALSSSSLTSAVVLFDNQVDPVGNPLGLDGEILVHGPDLQTTVWELMNSEFIVYGGASAAKQPSKNQWFQRFRPVKSRYINKSAFTGYSTTAWWLIGNPAIIPVIEVAALGGVIMPTVQVAGPDFQFNILGITTRAFFDVGCNVQNFRGGLKSAGA